MAPQLSAGFQQSYLEFESYPKSLVQERLYNGAAEAYVKRLCDPEAKLLVRDDKLTYIVAHDHCYRGKDFEISCLESDFDVQEWLGDTSLMSARTSNRTALTGCLATEKDAGCRFVFLSPEDSRSKLPITQKSLGRLFTYHQVMPEYLDLLSPFGEQIGTPDLVHSAFQESMSLDNPVTALEMPDLGRSGQHFQICYNLRTVAYKTKDQSWSIRPAAFHHQFDVKEGRAFWIVTSGYQSGIEERIEDLTSSKGNPLHRDFSTPEASLRASLVIHTLCAHWAQDSWGSYLHWMEKQVKEKTGAAVGERRNQSNKTEFTLDDLQSIQKLIERLNDVTLAIDGNLQVLGSLREFYEGLLSNQGFPLWSSCKSSITAFGTYVKKIEKSLTSEKNRAEHLAKIVVNRRELVLQYIQGQSVERMEYLNVDTRRIAIKSRREAVIMRIITVITLLFLPGTFVSVSFTHLPNLWKSRDLSRSGADETVKKTFFSTDIIKYQNEGNGKFSKVAMFRWIEVTVVLTLLTLGIAGVLWFRGRRKSREEENQLERRRVTLDMV